MKKIVLSLLALITSNVYAQQKGISYQAVILNPKSVKAPGFDIANSPLASKKVCMLFEIVDGASQVEYQESVQTSTDQFGMVNLTIGNGTKTGGYAANFSRIGWVEGNKKLVVSINVTGTCANYTKISDQQLMYTPYALFAENANISDSYITTVKIADGAITDAKVAAGISPVKVGLGNVNNTSDANKPVSTATQTALDAKENTTNKSTAISLGTSNVLFPTQNAVKTYVDTKVLTSPQGLTGAQGLKGDKGDIGAAGINGTNGSDASITLGNVDNTSDLNKPVSTATLTALNTKAAISGQAFTGGVSATNLSGTNTGDQTLSGLGGVASNTAIIGAVKTKITYDAKGLVTAGTDATTADIAVSTDKKYVTDVQLGVVANTSGTNTGDNAVNSLYSGLVSNAEHTGDATGATALTVVKINGVSMAGLATGILKNTTTTGVPSIAINSDLPAMSATLGGAVPTPPNNITTFLRGDGTWATPAGGGDMTLAGTQTVTGAKTFGAAGNVGKLIIAGTTSGTTILNANATAGTGTVTLPITGTLATLDGTETLTNKRINRRVSTTASSATPTPNAITDDVFTITALAAGAIFAAPSGTPTEGQGLIIRIKDNATARALAFDAIYRFSTDITAPTTTVISKTMYLGFMWNAADSKWDCVAKIDNF